MGNKDSKVMHHESSESSQKKLVTYNNTTSFDKETSTAIRNQYFKAQNHPSEQHQFYYLKGALQKQMYLTEGGSSFEIRTADIQKRIKTIENKNRFKEQIKKSPVQLIEYTYEKARFYHFKRSYAQAQECVKLLLSQYSAELKQAKISVLNLQIFRFLIKVSYSIRDKNIGQNSLTQFRNDYIQLTRQILDQPLRQEERQQMLLFVSSLYYNYSLAKWNHINLTRQFNQESADFTLNSEFIQTELQCLAEVVLRFGLQLKIGRRDRTVKQIELINLNPLLYKHKKVNQVQQWQIKKSDHLYVIQATNKSTVYVPRRGLELNLPEASLDDNHYLVQSTIFQDLEMQATKTQKCNFYFPNLSTVYICKSNSTVNPGLRPIWLQTYECSQFYQIKNEDWQSLLASSLSISITKESQQSQNTNIKKQLEQSLNKFVKAQQRSVNIMAIVSKQPIIQQSSFNTNRNQPDWKRVKGKKSFWPQEQIDKPEQQKRNQAQPKDTSLIDIDESHQHSKQSPKAKLMGKQSPANYWPKNNNHQGRKEIQQLQQPIQNKADIQIHRSYISHVKQLQARSRLGAHQQRPSNSNGAVSPKKQILPKYDIPKAHNPIKKLPSVSGNSNKKWGRGLKNLGNTCYMNSALQCLHKSRHFTDDFHWLAEQIKNKFRNSARGFQLTELFKVFIQQMQQQNQDLNPFNPRKIKEVMGQKNFLFSQNNQSDATQFLITFLQIIREELNDPKQAQPKQIDHYRQLFQTIYQKLKFNDAIQYQSVIQSTFTGRYRVVYSSTVPQCRHKYTLFEQFNVHYLSIPPNTHSLTLQQCLQHFTETEALKGENVVTCDLCHAETLGKKKMEIYEANKVLVLGFKRFLNGRKNDARIQVPEFLQVKDVICGPLQGYKGLIYRMYGAIIHFGDLNGGHYIAVCYNHKAGKWMKYNDSNVTQTSQNFSEIDFGNAITLFYELDQCKQQREAIKSQPDELIQASEQETNFRFKLGTEQQKTYNLIYTVINWLIRSAPFQEQFQKRFQTLKRYQLQPQDDLLKFIEIMQKGVVEPPYIVEMIVKVQSALKAFYDSELSQLQNFINSFLMMISQVFYNSAKSLLTQKNLPASYKKQFQQTFQKDIRADLLLAKMTKTCYLNCNHRLTQGFGQNYKTIELTGNKQQDNSIIIDYFNEKIRCKSDKILQCQKCRKASSYQFEYQINMTNRLFVIELARFTGSQKNSNIVKVPIQLPIRTIITEYHHAYYKDKIYRLSAVISHKGPSIKEGQYFLQSHNLKTARWIYSLNQETYDIGSATPKFENAYCLIYELVRI